MTKNEAIELHIKENLHRIETIEEFLRENSDAEDKECKKNIQILTKINGALREYKQYQAIGAIGELINRKCIAEEIDNLIKSPYANDTHFGAERKEVMETIKALCLEKSPIKIEEKPASYKPVTGKFYYGQQLYIKETKNNYRR